MRLPEYIIESKDYLRELAIPNSFDAAIILGSGLGSFASTIKNKNSTAYSTIPHFPEPSVKGHSGKLIWGKVDDKDVLAFSGRFHFYEGFSFDQAVLPVYIAKALNAQKLIVSNAAGAINPEFHIGDMMIIDSAIRLNNTTSPKSKKPVRFSAFNRAEDALKLAKQFEFPHRSGNYLYAKGPNYETKAEIRAFQKMGADAVGMSTVPELFEAARCELHCVAISLITNMAAGIEKKKLNHAEVKQTAKAKEKEFEQLIRMLIAEL